MKMAMTGLFAAIAVSGCATSAKGLESSALDATVTSTKTSQQFATCVVEVLSADNQLRNDGDHYWVLRMNAFGVPVSRWDFRPTASGSVAELRASVRINSGENKVKACA